MKNLTEYDFPEDIKNMSYEELDLLAVGIREFLIENVSKTGGHLASNLGVVELTIAMHKVFDSPKDKFIWDVGHQSYVHKILTGRAGLFGSLRQTDGMSGFPKRKESEHDIYETGHASTSLSAACGIAAARDIKGEHFEVVPVIGDGSLTGGLAYEALNNIGSRKSKVIVILNDNGMSISKNIGGMSNHLADLRTSSGYTRAKNRIRTMLSHIPVVGPALAEGISGTKETIKYMLSPEGIFFEEIGFTYIGPVNGHDIKALTKALLAAKQASKPVLIHVITKKGKGYRNAEENPDRFHGIGPFDPETGAEKSPGAVTYSQVMGDELTKIAEKDERVCAITAAMGDATGLSGFAGEFPRRFFDVGIAEEHAVTFASGLAAGGMRPVCAIYSSFLQRSFDQIMEDAALQKLPVVFAIDRAGIVGADGETHHGLFDISYMSLIPGMTVFAPCDGKQLREMLRIALDMDGLAAVRYPRGCCSDEDLGYPEYKGGNIRVSSGKDADIWAVGPMLDKAVEARSILAERGIDAGIVDVACPHPVDTSLIERGKPVFTVEDGIDEGGFGQQLKARLAGTCDVTVMAWPERFIEHGSCEDLYERYGLSGNKIAERIRKQLEGEN
ncbi:MAG: 1-deoxy-D-xylulose-5-phosphate synthase [Eubacterium sp.]|nr:1-deoxy-D-xylulose-5-phosphate synthase [Eubacterium sp.]